MTRNDKKQRGNITRFGRCLKCGVIVLNLQLHLLRIHGLTKTDVEFGKLIKQSRKCRKMEHFWFENKVNYNPLCKNINK